ncbi:MAG: hypothetical protein RL499_1407, partial [Actinomycetota bacterium]
MGGEPGPPQPPDPVQRPPTPPQPPAPSIHLQESPLMITRVLTLVAYTALPIVGVLWLGWDWREIVLLYWLENISLGLAMFVTLLRVARATPMPAPTPATTPEAQPTPASSTHPTLDPTTHPVGG